MKRTFQAYLRHYKGLVKRQLRSVIPASRSRIFGGFLLGRQFGLEHLDTKLIEVLNIRNGYYVEIGANDGVTQSNTLALELFFGWKGLLIEPIQVTFDQLRSNRSRRRNAIVKSACVGFDFGADTVRLASANLMSTAIGLESDIVDPIAHAKDGLLFLPSSIDGSVPHLEYEDVPARTMDSILKSAKAPKRMELLSLDVEGAEMEVLKGIDFETYRFNWMLIECRNLPKMTKFLAAKSYCFHSQLSPNDYLFKDLAEI
jgi:FkbM family methyltransferase